LTDLPLSTTQVQVATGLTVALEAAHENPQTDGVQVNELTEINDQLANAIGEQIEQPLSEGRTAGQIDFVRAAYAALNA
jgi:hypothetical protein